MDTEEPVGLLIGTVRSRIRQAVGSRVQRYHLSSQQFWILVAIYEHPGFSLGELAAHLHMDTPTASRLVFALMKRKLIEVRDDAADRRRACLHLDARGSALAAELHELATTLRAAVVQGLSRTQLATLRSLLRKIVANMDEFQNGKAPDDEDSTPSPARSGPRPARRLGVARP
jgi:DNA-binding MarR family transcriptional regulator